MSPPYPPLWHILLLLTAFATITTPCIPPFNDFKYTENATLLEEVAAQYDVNPAMGWAHVLAGTSPLKPWPKDDKGIVNIKYCWPDLETRAKLGPAIQGGWEIWHNLLGNGGSGKGHRVGGFSEQTYNKEMVFCWLDEDRQTWNPKVPSGTLVIDILPDKSWGGFATLGFKPEEWDNRPHRNQLRMGWSHDYAGNEAFQSWIAAHEIGHVLGLAHEHQRPDRDHYVHFECKNLANYAKAAEATRSSATMTMDKLCTSPIYSLLSPWNQLGFVPHEYSTQAFWDMFHKKNGQYDGTDHRYTVTHERGYDIMSIMHYPSLMNMAGGREWNVQTMPLVAWKKGGAGYAPPKEATKEHAGFLGVNMTPTESDLEAVRMLYPWEG